MRFVVMVILSVIAGVAAVRHTAAPATNAQAQAAHATEIPGTATPTATPGTHRLRKGKSVSNGWQKNFVCDLATGNCIYLGLPELGAIDAQGNRPDLDQYFLWVWAVEEGGLNAPLPSSLGNISARDSEGYVYTAEPGSPSDQGGAPLQLGTLTPDAPVNAGWIELAIPARPSTYGLDLRWSEGGILSAAVVQLVIGERLPGRASRL